MGKLWPSKWYCAIRGIVSFLILLGGIESSRVDLMVAGAILLLMAVSTSITEGYGKPFSPKVRRLQCVVSGGLFAGFAILATLRVLFGPLPYPHSFLLFLVLIAVGAYIGDIVGRKLRWY